ncbi:hypothetical protein ACWT_4255 [Actinoplanes sp. SE50]|uniref:DUF58 domain-containing protein n=1 Tax=unclassified Actinoplanes TaxID=2626549 RepID=UPI00023EC4A7|nr:MULTISPECIES: DUF58 domain-containing protein [unclassified Actinoplanes]AEV85275.1 uncharacterized protein ACPL_4384 [Actinoplanes sp. SE50/110]ATO83670.1 hypothetical protein ACWT_4255 [Actinoplanes sp. SE50]SLM01078.1 lipoprotein [Actinoplanes sp. SE50/110]
MITRRFAGLLAAGLPLPALLPSPWLGLAVVLILAGGLALADLAVAGPLNGLRLRRDGDRTVWLGHPATTRLTVTNTSDRTVRVGLRDSWVPSAGAGPLRHSLELAPGGEGTVTTTLTPTRHGDRPAVRVTTRSYGPLGLAYRQRRRAFNDRQTPAWTLRVLPRFPSRRILPEKLARIRVLDGAVVTRGRGHGTEFDVLREYVIGDDVRSIDWRASARHHDVVVRTWRPERDRRVYCVLDTGRTSAVRIGDAPRLDNAIDAALLLSVLAARADDRVDLLALDTEIRVRVEGGGHRTQLPRLIDGMASLEPALAETDFTLLGRELLRRDRKRALVVIFTALDTAPMIEGLLPVLPRLAARHKVVVAGVRDPQVARLAALPATPTAADVHTAAAAERVLAERDRVRDVLGRSGATVVDADAADFASRVADVYLLLKASGRL